MRLDHGESIDSRCGLCQREQEIGPETMAEGWVQRSNGTRLYVCPRHARDLGRFGVALEDMEEVPNADVCTGCNHLTRKADMAHPRVCNECAGDEYADAVLKAAGRDSLTFEEATSLLEDLVDEDEEVDPEDAAEAIERWSGMPMTPAPEEGETDDEAVEE